MELDSFLASPRWEILQVIAKRPSSPLEIAPKIGTTVSFVSQQLKLLEAAGIVKKQRTGFAEKGKPRTLFSLRRETAYVIPLSRDLSNKKNYILHAEQKITFKIWNLSDRALQSDLQRLFWSVHPFLENISGIFLKQGDSKATCWIICEKPFVQKIKGVKHDGAQAVAKVVASASEISSSDLSSIVPLYDPNGIFEKEAIVKGGDI